jgi:phytanoyl-CoA hydroxylase
MVFFSGADRRDYLLPGAVRVALGIKNEGPFVENSIRSHKASFYLDSKAEAATILELSVSRSCSLSES